MKFLIEFFLLATKSLAEFNLILLHTFTSKCSVH